MKREPERTPWFYWPVTLIAVILAALIVTQYIDDAAERDTHRGHVHAAR